MDEIESFLQDLKQRGLSSPAGIHWHRFCRFLVRHQDGESSEALPNPLVLGGAIASHAQKHERLAEQLRWAESHGCLPAAFRYLDSIPVEKWNQSSGDDWDAEHPDAIEARLNRHRDS